MLCGFKQPTGIKLMKDFGVVLAFNSSKKTALQLPNSELTENFATVGVKRSPVCGRLIFTVQLKERETAKIKFCVIQMQTTN